MLANMFSFVLTNMWLMLTNISYKPYDFTKDQEHQVWLILANMSSFVLTNISSFVDVYKGGNNVLLNVLGGGFT